MLERVPLLDKHLDDYERRRRARHARAHPRARGAAARRPGAARQRDRLRRWRRRAPRDPRRRCCATSASKPSGRSSTAATSSSASPRRCTTRCKAPTSSGTPRWSASTSSASSTTRSQLDGEWDYIVIHDPQPAAMREFVRGRGVATREHQVDLALPHRPHRCEPDRCGTSTGRSSSSTTRRCGRCRSSCRRRCSMDRVVHRAAVHRPALGEEPRARRPVRQGDRARATASAPDDPLLVQVSRFDPWKDPIGVIEAFRIVREEFPTRSSCSPGRWRPTTPRASTTGSSRTRRAPATRTSTCCRTSSRSARCRSTRSNAPPTSSSRSRCARASGSR